MGMEKYDALYKCMFIIIETIVNRAWRLDMFHRSYMFFKELVHVY